MKKDEEYYDELREGWRRRKLSEEEKKPIREIDDDLGDFEDDDDLDANDPKRIPST